MRIWTGNALRTATRRSAQFPRKDCHASLVDYLTDTQDSRVCILVGLLWTGKRTLMQQAVCEIGDYEHTLWLQCDETDTMDELEDKIARYPQAKYIFVEEATVLQDFYNDGDLLAFHAEREHQKVVLTGRKSHELLSVPNENAWCEHCAKPLVIRTTPLSAEEKRRFAVPNANYQLRYGCIFLPDVFSAMSAADYIERAVVQNICQTTEDLMDSLSYHGGSALVDALCGNRLDKMVQGAVWHPELVRNKERSILELLDALDVTALDFEEGSEHA